MAHASPTVQARLYEVDGLRGWASLSVMLHHLFFGVFGNLEPPLLTPSLTPFLEPFLAGAVDVAIFFVLSGDALSAAYWTRRSREGVVRLAIKRYFRLGVPIFGSCLIVFGLINFGLVFNQPASSLLKGQDWLGGCLQGDFVITDLMGYVGFDVFFHHTKERSLNPFLWTMQIELVGSILVFCYLLLESHISMKSTALIFITLVCLGGSSLLACFSFGVLCAYVRARGGFDWLRRRRLAQTLAVLGAFSAWVMGAWCIRTWQGWNLPIIIASCIIVPSVYTSAALSRFFALPFSRWLGRISFPLYLVHFPVIASFTSGMVVLADAHGALGPATIWLIILGSAVLSLLAAVLFLPVEVLTARIGNLVCQAVMGGQLTVGRATLLPAFSRGQRPGTPAGD